MIAVCAFHCRPVQHDRMVGASRRLRLFRLAGDGMDFDHIGVGGIDLFAFLFHKGADTVVVGLADAELIAALLVGDVHQRSLAFADQLPGVAVLLFHLIAGGALQGVPRQHSGVVAVEHDGRALHGTEVGHRGQNRADLGLGDLSQVVCDCADTEAVVGLRLQTCHHKGGLFGRADLLQLAADILIDMVFRRAVCLRPFKRQRIMARLLDEHGAHRLRPKGDIDRLAHSRQRRLAVDRRS